MTDIQSFISFLNDTVNEHFPSTKIYIAKGGDFIKDVVMELREEDKSLKYSPYELFHKSENYEDTIEQFLKQWESIK